MLWVHSCHKNEKAGLTLRDNHERREKFFVGDLTTIKNVNLFLKKRNKKIIIRLCIGGGIFRRY